MKRVWQRFNGTLQLSIGGDVGYDPRRYRRPGHAA